MSYIPQLNGSLSGNSLGKLDGQIMVTQPLPNDFSANATINMYQGKASLGGVGVDYQINKDMSVGANVMTNRGRVVGGGVGFRMKF